MLHKDVNSDANKYKIGQRMPDLTDVNSDAKKNKTE